MPALLLLLHSPTASTFFRSGPLYFPIIAFNCWLPCHNSMIRSIRNVRLANYLLRLLLRKQGLRALICLFPKPNGVSGHSSVFLRLQMPRTKQKSSLSITSPTAKQAHTSRAFTEAKKPIKGVQSLH